MKGMGNSPFLNRMKSRLGKKLALQMRHGNSKRFVAAAEELTAVQTDERHIGIWQMASRVLSRLPRPAGRRSQSRYIVFSASVLAWMCRESRAHLWLNQGVTSETFSKCWLEKDGLVSSNVQTLKFVSWCGPNV